MILRSNAGAELQPELFCDDRLSEFWIALWQRPERILSGDGKPEAFPEPGTDEFLLALGPKKR